MNRAEQVKICKVCLNRKFDFNRGIICGLTDEPATFENSCDLYEEDEKASRELEIQALQSEDNYELSSSKKDISNINPADLKQHLEGNRVVQNAANWFYWIAALSLINTISLLAGSDFGFIVGLGITQIFDGILFELMGEFSAWNLIPAFVFSGTFAVIGYYANKHFKNAFLLGMIFYGFDTILFVIVMDVISIGFHIFALFMIFKGFKHLKESEKNSEIDTKSLY